jgi:predicted Zn-dependent protease
MVTPDMGSVPAQWCQRSASSRNARVAATDPHGRPNIVTTGWATYVVIAGGAGSDGADESWRYARAMAQMRAGDLQAAAIERQHLGELTEGSDFSELAAWYVPAKEVLTLAGKVVDGQLARATRDYPQAEAVLREAAAIQAALPYMEPPYWYYPVRQTLAAVLLEAGKPDSAVQEFKAALMEAPNNAFALYGLMQAHEAAGDPAGAKTSKAPFDKAWAGGADMPTLARL